MCTGGLEVPRHSRLTLSYGSIEVGHITCERVMSRMNESCHICIVSLEVLSHARLTLGHGSMEVSQITCERGMSRMNRPRME